MTSDWWPENGETRKLKLEIGKAGMGLPAVESPWVRNLPERFFNNAPGKLFISGEMPANLK